MRTDLVSFNHSVGVDGDFFFFVKKYGFQNARVRVDRD